MSDFVLTSRGVHHCLPLENRRSTSSGISVGSTRLTNSECQTSVLQESSIVFALAESTKPSSAIGADRKERRKSSRLGLITLPQGTSATGRRFWTRALILKWTLAPFSARSCTESPRVPAVTDIPRASAQQKFPAMWLRDNSRFLVKPVPGAISRPRLAASCSARCSRP
jgi:hypothetical protein